MFDSTKLPINYTILALIATAVNIGTQEIVIRAANGAFDIFASVIIGTGAGLVVKYILDKRYIFRFRTRGIAHNTRTFALYTVMGLVTTMVFWGFEFGFHYIFESKEMRYLGGALGLAVGYVTKYRLDKHYVFRTEAV